MLRPLIAILLFLPGLTLIGQEIIVNYNVGSIPNEFAKCQRSIEYKKDGTLVSHEEYRSQIDADQVENNIIYLKFDQWDITHKSAQSSPVVINPQSIKIKQNSPVLKLAGDTKKYILDLSKDKRELKIPFKIIGTGGAKITIPLYIKDIRHTAYNHTQVRIINGPNPEKKKAVAITEKETPIEKNENDKKVRKTQKPDVKTTTPIKNPVPSNEESSEEETNENIEALLASEISHSVKEIPREGSILYEIDVQNCARPRILKSQLDDGFSLDASRLHDEHKLQISSENEGKAEIKLIDSLLEKSYTLSVENQFQADLAFDDNSINLMVKGGIPPYKVLFQTEEEGENIENRMTDLLPQGNVINISPKKLKNQGIHGYIQGLSVFDARATEEIKLPINLDLEDNLSSGMWWWILPLGLLGALGIALFMRSKKQEERKKVFESKAKEVQRDQKSKDQASAQSRSRQKISIQNKKPIATSPVNRKRDLDSSKFKIKPKKRKGGRMQRDEFHHYISEGNHINVNLNSHWPDTKVSNIQINPKFCLSLSEFLKRENLDRIHVEKMGLVPEVGGFILGNHYMDTKNSRHEISLDTFVPFVPDYHDLYKIEIGTSTLVQELGDAQDLHPDKSVVGWFHTHPGHGLFLSNADLAVHRHFPREYQVAMEIDSMTQRLDLAFFTWNSKNRMNNVEDLHQNTQWFSWRKFQSELKGKAE